MKYTGEWRDYITRQARWVDFDHDYRTMNPDYMESVIWAFKQLHEKGLVYEGFRVLPYCWNDETPLSNHELRMDDDVYQNRVDPAVTVGLPPGDRASWPWSGRRPRGRSRPTSRSWSARTSTTSWSRRACPATRSASSGTSWRRPGWRRTPRSWAARTAEPVVVERLKGSDLLGRTYTPPFAYYLGHPRAFRVVRGRLRHHHRRHRAGPHRRRVR